ncbi:MAG TPA: MFS transporter [Thermoplasmata archaeon]|nr:MFS transporter [Thermoplasmata archaeon]
MSAVPSPPRPAAEVHATRILIVLATAALVVSFIETMLTPALPTLGTFFGNAPYTTVVWILSAYLLVGVATIPVTAKLGDLFGKRRVLAIVLSIYVVAVALAPATPLIASAFGLDRAHAIYLLIGTRGVQGIGLAMFPLALAMVAEALPPARVAPAQGIVASMFAVGSAFGLVLGSWLIDRFGWQLAYAAVVPIALALPILARSWLPDGLRGTGGKIDLAGAGLLGGGLAAFLLGLTLGPSWGWTDLRGSGGPWGVPETLVLAAVLGVLFVWRSRTTDEPLVDLSRLGERNVALGYLGAMLVGLAMYVGFVVLTVLVEFPVVGLGESVFAFGLLSIPTTVGMFVAAPLVGRGVARWGPRPMVVIGSAVAGAGFLLLLAWHATYLELIGEAIPTFVGLVAVLVSVTNAVAMSARRGEAGIHMGLTEMFQDLGASAGPVAVAAILATFTRVILVPNPSVPSGFASTVVPSAAAFTWTFGLGAALMLAAGIVGVFFENYRAGSARDAGARATPPPAPAAASP